MYKKPLDEQQPPTEKQLYWKTEGGFLYHGLPGLSRGRWQFWKQRFSEVKDEVDEVTGKMAVEAVSEMEKIEKGMEQRDVVSRDQ